MEAVLTGPMGRTLLGASEVTIGCDADNSLVIADLRTAAHHALVRPDGLGYAVIDLGSEYGTIVNGRWLEPGKARPLLPGDIIQIGTTTFTFEVFQTPASIPTGMLGVGVGSVGNTPAPLADMAAYDTARFDKLPEPPTLAPPASVAPAKPEGNASSLRSLPGQARPYSSQPWVSSSTTTYPSQQLLWQQDRRRLYLALAVLLAIVIIFSLISLIASRSTPDKTLDMFCNAILAGNGPLAENQLSTRLQNEQGAGLAVSLSARKASACTHTSAITRGSSAQATLTIKFPANSVSSGTPVTTLATLVQDANGVWKIDALQSQ